MNTPGFPDHKLQLKSGKNISFLKAGDLSSSEVVFYFHGFPGSKLEGILLDDEAKKGGLQIVSCDRPGMGESDPDPEHCVSNWGAKARELADHLNTDRFSIIGVSGGAPYAISAALAMPDRVKRLALVSGMAPVGEPGVLEGMISQNRWLLREGSKRPWLVRPVVKMMGRLWQRSPAVTLFYLKRVLPEADRRLMSAPENHRLLKSNLKMAFRQGVEGAMQEFWNLVKPWEIDPRNITCPSFVWHGLADNYVPEAMGRWLADSIPGSVLHLLEDQGHFMALGMAETVLKELIPAYGDSPEAAISN